MFSYRKIVFGIKHRYQMSDVMKIFKEQRNYSILITQHNPMDDDCCDRSEEHFHGVVEFNGGGKLDNFLQNLSPYCYFIDHHNCSSPVEYLAYITLPPKHTVVQEILNSSELFKYLLDASGMQAEVLGRKNDRRISLIEQNSKVISAVDILLKHGLKYYNIFGQSKESEPLFQNWLNDIKDMAPDLLHKTIKTALNVSKKIVLNSSILVLSDRFELQGDYLSPHESANFVLDWCSYQNLNPKEFIKNLIKCLDKKCGNRNAIYLQGSPNSGKSYIIQSIIEACIHVGQVRVESSSYVYAWQNCVDKRLIVLMEPYFSMVNFDQLDKILSGSGTVIYKHNDLLDYLHPTPVIILANEHAWSNDPELCGKIKKRFLCSYMDLKNYPIVNEKKLHPSWLSLLNKKFASRNGLKARQRNSETSSQGPSISDTSNGMPSTSNEYLNLDDKHVSSHPLKTSGDSALCETQVLINTKRVSGSENVLEPNPKCKKLRRNIGPD